MQLTSAKDIWETALGELQIQITRPNYDTWLKETVGIKYQDDLFVIGAPNTFVAEWLENRLRSLIKRTLSGIIGKKVDIQFVIQSRDRHDTRLASARQADGGTSVMLGKPEKLSHRNPRYTFSNFVAGAPNRLAYAAALEVAENPGSVYNPLFIYSDTGLGKTHLLHAIKHVAEANNYQVLYTSAEQLTNEFVVSLKNSRTEEFHYKYRNADFLLVDDFQFLAGKSQTQECFFHIFNCLHDNNCQIVITSDCPPKELPSLSRKLRSRLEGGLIADIRPLDIETRITILNIRVKQIKTAIPTEVLEFIATRFRNNVRELEGGLNRVVTYAKLCGMDIDMKLATQALADLLIKNDRHHSAPSTKHIIDTVANYFELAPEALIGKRRDRKTSHARQVAMYLLREQKNHRLSEIGELLGDRDHTTILHGCEKIAAEASINSQLSRCLDEIRRELGVHKGS